MYLPDFEYYAPDNVPEACRLLKELGSKAVVLAGGTDLLHKMKQGQLTPGAVVSLKNLADLRGIRCAPNGDISMGARVTQNEIADSRVLQERYRSLCEAAHNMANNQIRHIGTVGGNIVNAVPSADLPPILIALGARVRLVGYDGERVVPLEEIFVGVHRTVLNENELLTEVIIPQQATTGSTYIRFGLRRSGALAVAAVAVAVHMEGTVCRQAHIVLGAAGPVPMRAIAAERLLIDQKVDDTLLEEVGLAAAQASKPRSSIRGSAEYRRDLIRVLTGRALRKAVFEEQV